MTEVRAIAAELRVDAAERDLAAGTPWPQRERIRASGLLKLMVPIEFGGYGADWPTALRSIRELATADASLAHLFGYHHLGRGHATPDRHARATRALVHAHRARQPLLGQRAQSARPAHATGASTC